jgi:hypothetical protein
VPLPDLSTYCVKLTVPRELCVRLPGGAAICAVFPGGTIPSEGELTSALLAQVNTALTPLTPFFDVIDVFSAMINCIKAVEQCLGPPPDPTKLVQCFPALASAMAKLLELIPQLSVPILIGDLLDVLIAYLTGMRQQLGTFANKQAAIAAAATRAQALRSAPLTALVDCATDDLNVAIANLSQQGTAMARLIEVANVLLDLAGLSPIPTDITTISGDLKSALAPLSDAIQTLQTARAAFP